MVNSKDKGNRGERGWAKICQKYGFTEAKRGQQYSGLGGDDVVGLPGIHVEVKWVEDLVVDDAILQSQRDAEPDELPIVAHKKNHKLWLVTMGFSDWYHLARAGALPDAVRVEAALNEDLEPYIEGFTVRAVRTERLNIQKQMDKTPCNLYTLPVLFTKKPDRQWLATMKYNDWFVMYKRQIPRTVTLCDDIG